MNVFGTLNIVALILVIVGALNWGLIGTAMFDLVNAIFGAGILSAIVYTLVGVAGVYLAARLPVLVQPRHSAER